MTAPEHSMPPATIHVSCDGACKQPATYIAWIHNVDACCNAELNPDGDVIHLYCETHLATMAQLLGDVLKQRLGKLPNGVNFYMCQTCGRPIAGLCDILETEVL